MSAKTQTLKGVRCSCENTLNQVSKRETPNRGVTGATTQYPIRQRSLWAQKPKTLKRVGCCRSPEAQSGASSMKIRNTKRSSCFQKPKGVGGCKPKRVGGCAHKEWMSAKAQTQNPKGSSYVRKPKTRTGAGTKFRHPTGVGKNPKRSAKFQTQKNSGWVRKAKPSTEGAGAKTQHPYRRS